MEDYLIHLQSLIVEAVEPEKNSLMSLKANLSSIAQISRINSDKTNDMLMTKVHELQEAIQNDAISVWSNRLKLDPVFKDFLLYLGLQKVLDYNLMRDIVASFNKLSYTDKERIELKLQLFRKSKTNSPVLERLNKEIEERYAAMVPTQEDNEKLHLIY